MRAAAPSNWDHDIGGRQYGRSGGREDGRHAGRRSGKWPPPALSSNPDDHYGLRIDSRQVTKLRGNYTAVDSP